VSLSRLAPDLVLRQELFPEAGESESGARGAAALGPLRLIIIPAHQMSPNQWPDRAGVLRRVSTAGALPQVSQENHLRASQFHCRSSFHPSTI
jgi:hypothetical protein